MYMSDSNSNSIIVRVNNGHVPQQKRAWDLIGYEGSKAIRIVGGTTTYETVIYWDGQRSPKVKLAKLIVDKRGLRTVIRYVDPETPVELVDAR